MGRLREQYAIDEFLKARQALDAYYSSLTSLAWQIKRRRVSMRGSDQEVADRVEDMKIARERFRKAIENLGFSVVDQEGTKQV